MAASSVPAPLRNWARNQSFNAARVHSPSTVAELAEIVRGSASCKVLGSGHSFNDAAATAGDMICLDGLMSGGAGRHGEPPAAKVELDEATGVLSVPAGIKYGELISFLTGCGSSWALHNLASLPHISVGGSIATATHGSGVGNGNLASAVIGLELVTADGQVRTLRAGEPDFEGAVVHVGALGVVTYVVLQLVPSFDIAQTIYEDMPLETACGAFDEIMSAGYSVSLFTTWAADESGALRFEQVWRKVAATAPEAMPETWHGAKRAALPHHPCPGVSADPCTEQLGVAGPWHARLPHFRFEFTPSVGEELQSEFFVARADAPNALHALAGLASRIAPLLFITEVRAIAADKLWLSTAYGRESVALHFTWKAMDGPVRALLPDIEAALAPFSARPHWGKIFSVPGETLAQVYPRMADFRALRARLDPTGKFANAYTAACGL